MVVYRILAMNMDAEKLAAWLEDVIDKNELGAIVFIWDEFSEYFKNCQNSLIKTDMTVGIAILKRQKH